MSKLTKFPDVGHRIQDRIREVSRERGERVTYDKIALDLDVHVGTVTAWANGYQRPEGDNLLALARELETTPGWLLYGETEEAREEEKAEDLQTAELYSALDEIEGIIARVKDRQRKRAEAAARHQRLAREAREESERKRRAQGE